MTKQTINLDFLNNLNVAIKADEQRAAALIGFYTGINDCIDAKITIGPRVNQCANRKMFRDSLLFSLTGEKQMKKVPKVVTNNLTAICGLINRGKKITDKQMQVMPATLWDSLPKGGRNNNSLSLADKQQAHIESFIKTCIKNNYDALLNYLEDSILKFEPSLEILIKEEKQKRDKAQERKGSKQDK